MTAVQTKSGASIAGGEALRAGAENALISKKKITEKYQRFFLISSRIFFY